MKVKELSQQLQQFDPEAIVVVDGYEDGVCEPLLPVEVQIKLNVYQEDYYGPHEILDKDDSTLPTVNAVYLARVLR